METTALVIKQLAYLVALAREKHFGRAATACNVSQPTLSGAIRQLEDELGVPLVERGHRYTGLTAEGEMIVTQAKRILGEIDTMRDKDFRDACASVPFQRRYRLSRKSRGLFQSVFLR